jgi:lysyl-tRNA synthetase class 1
MDDPEASGVDQRALELSRAAGFQPLGVPFAHLVSVFQAAGFDTHKSVEILRRTGYPDADPAAVAGRMGYARNWLEAFAPDELRFSVQPELPPETDELDAEQREFLARLAQRLDAAMGAKEIHDLVYELASEFPQVKPAALFRAIYVSLLGKPRGPRAGWFIELLGPEFCATRFKEASGG